MQTQILFSVLESISFEVKLLPVLELAHKTLCVHEVSYMGVAQLLGLESLSPGLGREERSYNPFLIWIAWGSLARKKCIPTGHDRFAYPAASPTCPPDLKPVNCVMDPCNLATCPAHPGATCIGHYCGVCRARFFDATGVEVTDSVQCARKFFKERNSASMDRSCYF